MFSKGRNLTRQLRDIEKKQDRILKEFEKLRNQKDMEVLENQGRNNSEEQHSAWRQLMDNQEMQDAVTLTKYFGLGGAGLKYAHSKINEQLSEEQQKALLSNLETSYAIIEQQDNNCHIMDYWSKTEENRMLKLKRVEIKRPIWKFWN